MVASADFAPVEDFVHHVVAPEDVDASDGERLRGALTELGTTFIKFGQMLSLRPDVVGEDTANELSKLQANVPTRPARRRPGDSGGPARQAGLGTVRLF